MGKRKEGKNQEIMDNRLVTDKNASYTKSAQDKWEQIRLATISNDVKTLEKLLVDKESASLSFGRFPILSLAYLYSSYKVIRKYEKALSSIKEYVQVEENFDDYLLFKKKAKKSLRLYLNGQIITPIEMSAILCDSQGVSAHLNQKENLDRVRKIYRLTHNLEVKKSGNSIIVPRSKKPSFTQLIAVLCIVAVCVVFLSGAIVSMEIVPHILGGDGTTDAPIKILSTHLLELALDETNRYYTLENDLTIDATKWDKTEFKIHLDGQGRTITISGNRSSAFIDKFSGSIVNAKIVFTDLASDMPLNSAYFAKTVSGKIENVEFSFPDINLTAKSEGALVSYLSTGNFSGIKVNVNGVINEVSASEETLLGTLLYENRGIIDGCNVKYNLDITGDASQGSNQNQATNYGDAVFGGIVAKNSATIRNSNVLEGSTLNSNTVDVGGIAVENADKATITSVNNYATLTQTTPSLYWSPNVGGITMRNYGKISLATNHGAISATTTQDQQNTAIILGGVTTVNSGTIDNCLNSANITGTLEYGILNVGGIGYVNEGTVTNTTNTGNVSATITTAKEDSFEHHVSGGFAVNNGTLSYFKNTGNVNSQTSSGSIAFVGGAVGLNNHENAIILNCQSSGNITANTTQKDNKAVFVGGISAYLKGSVKNSFNTGSFITSSEEGSVIAGGIIGFTEVQAYSGQAVASPIYEWSNNYYVNDKGYNVGVGNYYVYELDPFFNMVVRRYYAEGSDEGATPTDFESIKNSGVYW